MYKRRTVRCEAHGLHFDPQLTKGCIRCRKEGISETPAKPQFLPLLLIVLTFTLVSALFADRLFEARAAGGATETEAVYSPVNTGLLDPELYRTHLMALESALDGDVADFSILDDRIAAAALELAAALRRGGAHRVAEPVSALGRRVAASELDLARLDEVRNAWSAIRDRNFRAARWLQRRPGSVDRTTVAIHYDVAQGLLDLVRERIDVAGTTPAEWGRSAPEWLARVDALRARLPPAPTYDTDPRLLLARRSLDESFEQLHTLASDSTPSDARPRLEAMAEALRGGRNDLDDLLR